jgi:hypothetical protein
MMIPALKSVRAGRPWDNRGCARILVLGFVALSGATACARSSTTRPDASLHCDGTDAVQVTNRTGGSVDV